MLTVYHCDSHCTSHHPPRIIRGGFFHPFLLPPSHGQPTTASTSHDDSLVCRSVRQQPTTANKGQRRSTKANAGQRRPTQAHECPQQPTTANKGQRSVFCFIFYLLFLLLRDSAHPTPHLQIRAGGGFT